MKKLKNGQYSRTFSVKNLLLSKYQDGILKSGSWDISIELQTEEMINLDAVSVGGLSVEDWIHSLLGQKLLVTEETDYTTHFTNRLVVNDFSEGYIAQLLELILKGKLPESVSIESVEIINH